MTYYEQHQSDFLEGLKTFLRIPSISTLSEHKLDILRAAEFARDELAGAGMITAELIEGDGNPLVYAEWLGAPGKPTVLFYGHYDVQPPDPLDEWHSPPFEPQVRGNDLFARGACDDKGQVYIQIKAVEEPAEDHRQAARQREVPAGRRRGDRRRAHRRVRAIEAAAPGQPMPPWSATPRCSRPSCPPSASACAASCIATCSCEGANHDLHSGVYGGAAPNPIQAIAEILCALKDRDGHILIPGFYDRVVPPSDKEREAWARLPFDVKEYTEKEMGARELVGEPGVPLFERLWARPTLEVHGIRGGFTGEGAKTVIPARATAKISTRLVADQRPDEAAEQLRAAIRGGLSQGRRRRS